MVAVYEQSLSNMTTRLQQETSMRERYEQENKQLQMHLHHGQVTSPSSETPLKHHVSSDSVSSLNSLTSNSTLDEKKKKKGWLRSSFSKLGNGSGQKKKNNNRTTRNGSFSDAEGGGGSDSLSIRSIESASVPNSPLPLHHLHNYASPTKDLPSVLELQQQLQEKDKELADTRLENLSSAHQIDQMRETLKRMKNEMMALKSDNQRLQKLASREENSQSSNSPLNSPQETIRKLSLTDDLLLGSEIDKDGRRICVRIEIGDGKDIVMSAVQVSGKTKWDNLDLQLKKVFREYVLRVDPVTNLGLESDSLQSYSIGDILRIPNMEETPELLPCGYLVGDNEIIVRLKNHEQECVEALSMDTLIPRNILHRYVSLLLEHGRLMLSGPSGTGKSHLARKLAEHVCLRLKQPLSSIASFQVEHKSSKELRAYLASVAEQMERNSSEAPSIILLDNVHHVLASLPEALEPFLSVTRNTRSPIIIGTMASSAAASLQLHHDFKWVLCATHVEPVKGLLGRILRRKLIEHEVKAQARDGALANLVDWLPRVWQHVNTFLETHASSDVTLGPRLFIGCPLQSDSAHVWFTDVWNYSLLPYIRDAVRDGLQMFGRRVANWSDPAQFVLDTFPWSRGPQMDAGLLRLRPEDVGFDTAPSNAPAVPVPSSPAPTRHSSQQNEALDNDPLTNMLMRLQEAAVTNCQSTDSEAGLDESRDES